MSIRVVHAPSASSVGQAAAIGGQEELRRYLQQQGIEQEKLNLSRYELLQRATLAREQMAQQNFSQARSLAFQRDRDIYQSQSQARRDRFMGDLQQQEVLGRAQDREANRALRVTELRSREQMAQDDIRFREQMAQDDQQGRMDLLQQGFMQRGQLADDAFARTTGVADMQRTQEFDTKIQSMLGQIQGAMGGVMDNPLAQQPIARLQKYQSLLGEALQRYHDAPSKENRRRYEQDASRIATAMSEIAQGLPEPTTPLDQAVGGMMSGKKLKEKYPQFKDALGIDDSMLYGVSSRNGVPTLQPMSEKPVTPLQRYTEFVNGVGFKILDSEAKAAAAAAKAAVTPYIPPTPAESGARLRELYEAMMVEAPGAAPSQGAVQSQGESIPATAAPSPAAGPTARFRTDAMTAPQMAVQHARQSYDQAIADKRAPRGTKYMTPGEIPEQLEYNMKILANKEAEDWASMKVAEQTGKITEKEGRAATPEEISSIRARVRIEQVTTQYKKILKRLRVTLISRFKAPTTPNVYRFGNTGI